MFSSMLAMASGTQKPQQQKAGSQTIQTNEQKGNLNKTSGNTAPKVNTEKMPNPNTQKVSPAPGLARSANTKQEPIVETRNPRKIVKPSTPRTTPNLAKGRIASSSNQASLAGSRARAPAPASRQDSSPKKLSFKELMKKANNVDGTKITVNVQTRKLDKAAKPAETSPELSSSKQKHVPQAPAGKALAGKAPAGKAPAGKAAPNAANFKAAKTAPSAKLTKSAGHVTDSKLRSSGIRRPVARAPLPAARPSAALQRKIDQRRKERDEDHDSDLDDFVVGSDEEDEPSYRDEIKKMFGSRTRRWDDEDEESDLSDMEATGAEIFEEERRSQRIGRMEDVAEERRLAELAERKRRRKAHM